MNLPQSSFAYCRCHLIHGCMWWVLCEYMGSVLMSIPLFFYAEQLENALYIYTCICVHFFCIFFTFPIQIHYENLWNLWFIAGRNYGFGVGSSVDKVLHKEMGRQQNIICTIISNDVVCYNVEQCIMYVIFHGLFLVYSYEDLLCQKNNKQKGILNSRLLTCVAFSHAAEIYVSALWNLCCWNLCYTLQGWEFISNSSWCVDRIIFCYDVNWEQRKTHFLPHHMKTYKTWILALHTGNMWYMYMVFG